MKELGSVVGRLKLESSLIFIALLIASIIVLVRDPHSVIGVILAGGAMFVGILGFVILSIRENYESLISQKDDMIKHLSRERTREIKHSESLRNQIEKNSTGGWEPAELPVE